MNNDDWMTKKWRPMMAITYMIICLCDFVIFPVFWTIVQFWETQAANDAFREWTSLTLHQTLHQPQDCQQLLPCLVFLWLALVGYEQTHIYWQQRRTL